MIWNSFGDFGMAGGRDTTIEGDQIQTDDYNLTWTTEWFLFYFSVFLMTLIMMNLYIGILSDELTKILEFRVKHKY